MKLQASLRKRRVSHEINWMNIKHSTDTEHKYKYKRGVYGNNETKSSKGIQSQKTRFFSISLLNRWYDDNNRVATIILSPKRTSSQSRLGVASNIWRSCEIPKITNWGCQRRIQNTCCSCRCRKDTKAVRVWWFAIYTFYNHHHIPVGNWKQQTTNEACASLKEIETNAYVVADSIKNFLYYLYEPIFTTNLLPDLLSTSRKLLIK